jgi:hypothetical protein
VLDRRPVCDESRWAQKHTRAGLRGTRRARREGERAPPGGRSPSGAAWGRGAGRGGGQAGGVLDIGVGKAWDSSEITRARVEAFSQSGLARWRWSNSSSTSCLTLR